MTFVFRSTSRSMKFSIWPAPRRPYTINSIRCKPRRSVCMVPSTCSASPAGEGQIYKHRPLRFMATQWFTRRKRIIGATSIRSVYGRAMMRASDAGTLFFYYRRQHRLPIKVARILNTYGPSMHPSDGRVVSNFIMQALRKEEITVYGEGNQTRSFCYVDDLVDGLIRLIETPDDVTGPVNLGNPIEFTIWQLAELVIDLTGSSSKIVFRPLPEDDPRQRCPDISLAKELLGWAPRVPARWSDEDHRIFRSTVGFGFKGRSPPNSCGQRRGLMG